MSYEQYTLKRWFSEPPQEEKPTEVDHLAIIEGYLYNTAQGIKELKAASRKEGELCALTIEPYSICVTKDGKDREVEYYKDDNEPFDTHYMEYWEWQEVTKKQIA
ncbi:UNVERIFIED_CONTAM: hypothetical protein RF648_18765 [Kocuria sp. CPCC 205274]|uniref:Uncharacterized protein n=1 Tax=Herbiconiux daphne TaxID=2970914 RepID=A0ABT2HAA4_9MICO|nr:hypothetical protein [Herbiconiux daphne]MCS5736867.1 hypothetical protein [Herbiconiux daphne]